MIEDVVRAFGYATLGSRLKRIGELLQAQTQELTVELTGTDLPTPYNPVLAALDRHGSLSIGDLATALGQSQPGVTRMIKNIKATGLVEAVPDDNDRRITAITLTEKGKALVAQLRATLWPAVTLAVAEACSDLEGPLLTQLGQLEDALSERPLKKHPRRSPLPNWDELVSPGG